MLGGIKLGVGVQLDRALLALGFRHLGAAGAFGVQLLQHGRPCGVIKADIQNLGTRHFDAPILYHRRHLFADLLNQVRAVGLHLIQFQLADFTAHDTCNGGGNGPIDIPDSIHGLFRLCDAVEDAGFHPDKHVVGGDGILAGCGKLAFQHRNLMRHPVQKRHDEVDARPQHGAQTAKAFHHMLFALRHDSDAQKQAEQDEGCKRKQNGVTAQKVIDVHGKFPQVATSTWSRQANCAMLCPCQNRTLPDPALRRAGLRQALVALPCRFPARLARITDLK